VTDRVKATCLVLLTFTGGIVLGGMLAFFLVQPRFPGPGRGFPERSQQPRDQTRGAMGLLTDGLGLDETQQDELNRILRESRQTLNQLNQQTNRRNRAIREKAQEQIRQILDPAQMEQFEEFLARLNRMLQRQRSNPGSRRSPSNPR